MNYIDYCQNMCPRGWVICDSKEHELFNFNSTYYKDDPNNIALGLLVYENKNISVMLNNNKFTCM